MFKSKTCYVVLTRVSLCTAAISYTAEADGERRKQGLPSRVMFLSKFHTDTDYQFNGTLDLRGQNQESCVKIIAKLKVKHTFRSAGYIHPESQEQFEVVC